MSRCFPFPPPGYVKKPRVDDIDLITKEKQKEKKHKKDKKEKEKREGSEKKDKDRSKDKHREKKNRKEKHKDKDDRQEKHRDDKDRDRDKEKARILDDKRFEGQPGSFNGQKLGSNSLQSNEIKDFKYVAELARRISNENGASGSQTVQNVPATSQGRAELQRTAVGTAPSSQSIERDKVRNKIEDNRKVNGQNIHNDTRNTEKASVQRFFAVDQEMVGGITKSMEERDGGMLPEARKKSKHKEGDSKGDKQKSKEHDKSKKSKDRDKEKERKKEEKARKIAEQSAGQLKVNDPGVIPRDNSSSKPKESGKDSLDVRNIKPSHPLNLGSTSSIGEGNLGKRKEPEINGFFLENGDRPNKSLKSLSSSRPVIENGRKLEPGSVAIQHGSEKQGAPNNHRVDSKEHKRNGLIMTQPVNASSIKTSTDVTGSENGQTSTRPVHPDSKGHKINGLIVPQSPSTPLKTPLPSTPLKMPLPSTATVNDNGETSVKPPHPDIKYLSRILSVPKLDELPDLIEDDWLSTNSHSEMKESIRRSPGNDETRQVWSEVIRIESADICALPYVIPY